MTGILHYRAPKVDSNGILMNNSSTKPYSAFHSIKTPCCGELHSHKYKRSKKRHDFVVEYSERGLLHCGHIDHFEADENGKVSAYIIKLIQHKEMSFNVHHISQYLVPR